MGIRVRAAWLLMAVLLGAAGSALSRVDSPMRAGTIVVGIPRADFVVLGADRLWTSVLPRPGDAPWERQGRKVKIAVHERLPLAIAVAGLSTLGPRQDTIEHVRELIAPLDRSSLDFDALVERLRPDLQEKLRAVRAPARRALQANPDDAQAVLRLRAARLTLLIAYVAEGRATLGWLRIDDQWQAKRELAPRGAVAWPSALDDFYARGPFAGAAAMYAYPIQESTKLAGHVRRVIDEGIREDARLNDERARHVGGPVDVVLVDAQGVHCVPPCSPR